MSNEIAVALISASAAAVSSFLGIMVSSSKTQYRIEQLEQKINKHNDVITRTFVLEEKIKVANNRLDDLEHS